MLRGHALAIATDSPKFSMTKNITDPEPRWSEDVVSDSAVQSPSGHYEYEPINTKSADTFRLLLLEPGTWEDPLKGIIFVARQTDGIDYAALSYVCGETKHQELISIDGKQLTIGANLSEFLHHLRNPDQTLTLWTDAVCIDQENRSERGHQVRLMGDIYGNASNVYAWLGKDTHGIATLTSFLSQQAVSRASGDASKPPSFKDKTREVARRLIAVRKRPTRAVKITMDETNKHIVESRNPYKLIDAVNKTIDPLEKQARHVFVDLCKRPYWTRLWIIQELLLARSVIVCLGQKRIAWKSFSITIDSSALQWPAAIWPMGCRINSVQSLIEMMELPIKDRYSTLEELLRRYNQQECLDTRDRIYALLSLARDCNTIIPDYTKNRLDLFFQLKGMVRNGRLLKGALELYTDEIMYRAETLGIPYKSCY